MNLSLITNAFIFSLLVHSVKLDHLYKQSHNITINTTSIWNIEMCITEKRGYILYVSDSNDDFVTIKFEGENQISVEMKMNQIKLRVKFASEMQLNDKYLNLTLEINGSNSRINNKLIVRNVRNKQGRLKLKERKNPSNYLFIGNLPTRPTNENAMVSCLIRLSIDDKDVTDLQAVGSDIKPQCNNDKCQTTTTEHYNNKIILTTSSYKSASVSQFSIKFVVISLSIFLVMFILAAFVVFKLIKRNVDNVIQNQIITSEKCSEMNGQDSYMRGIGEGIIKSNIYCPRLVTNKGFNDMISNEDGEDEYGLVEDGGVYDYIALDVMDYSK